MNIKKILFIGGLGRGGAERVMAGLINILCAHDYDVTLLTNVKKGIYLKSIDTRCKVLSFYGKSAFLCSLNFALQRFLKVSLHALPFVARFLIKKTRFDAIISVQAGFPVLVHRFLFDYSSLNVSWIHNDFMRNPFTKGRYFWCYGTERLAYEKMDVCITPSQSVAESFRQYFSFSKCASVVSVANCIFFSESIQEKKEAMQMEITHPCVCSVGRLSPIKRYDRLLQALALLDKRGISVECILIGDGDQRKCLEGLAVSLGIASRVKFLGTRDAPGHWLCRADIFVSTSDSESFGLAIGEAMMLGIPVVATATIGAKELLGNGSCGVLTDFTAEAVADGLHSVLSNPKLARSLSDKGREKAKEFSLEKMYASFLAVLEEAGGRKKRRNDETCYSLNNWFK